MQCHLIHPVSCKTDFPIFISFVYPLGLIVLLFYTLLFFFTTKAVRFQTQTMDVSCIHKPVSHPQTVGPNHTSAILAPFGPFMK